MRILKCTERIDFVSVIWGVSLVRGRLERADLRERGIDTERVKTEDRHVVGEGGFRPAGTTSQLGIGE